MGVALRPAQALALLQNVGLGMVRDVRPEAAPDFTLRQLAILLTVYLEPPPHTVRGLAARLGVTKPVFTRALDSLGKVELLSRRRDEADRRLPRIAGPANAVTVIVENALSQNRMMKPKDALRLGASHVVNSRDGAAMAAQAGQFNLILNTVAAPHNLDAFVSLLKRDGTLCLVGVPEHAHPSPSVANLIFKRRAIAGSLIGGIAETQEMLDFCAEHGIVAEIEMIDGKGIDVAYERMLTSDAKYRFVIDTATM